MNIFLIDNEKVYNYADLLSSLNSSYQYYRLYKTADIYAYFVNIIQAIAANKPLVLLDSDINSDEIDGIEENLVNVAEVVEHPVYESIQDVVAAFQQSTSKITIFTSGTTGQPKMVIHTMSTLTRSVRIGDKYQAQIWAYAYNPTHMAGLQVFFQAFENLNTLINVFNKQRREVYELIAKYKVTHVSATPTFYRLLLPYEKAYDSVIRVTLGGEKSDQNLYDTIVKIFPSAKINNVYASTEAGSLFAAKGDCFQIPKKLSNKFAVVDDELLIHKSLLGRSDGFTFEEDYYHSGDLIEWVDKEQRLFRFKSRKNELINVGGYKVNPGEVETVLLSIEGVKQVLVYGKANSVLGNVLCADIQLQDGSTLTNVDIKKALASKLQDFKIPRRMKFVDGFELTRTGKLKRS